MADQGEHGIPYVHLTWNVCRGCSPVSPGCANCFAPRNVARCSGPGKAYDGLVKSTSVGPRWTGAVRLAADILDLPLRIKTPKRIYVTVTGDPFHEEHTEDEIDAWLGGVAAAPWHTFICTTKRADRMQRHMNTIRERAGNRYLIPAIIGHAAAEAAKRGFKKAADGLHTAANRAAGRDYWPFPNLHLGVSVENQATANERIPLLLQTPAAIRWVSYEPALGPVDFKVAIPKGSATGVCSKCGWGESGIAANRTVIDERKYCPDDRLGALDWLVIGGESGPDARPFDIEWARWTIAQCKAAGVPMFMKQIGRYPHVGELGAGHANDFFSHANRHWRMDDHGAHVYEIRDPKGGALDEWPKDLKVRKFPRPV